MTRVIATLTVIALRAGFRRAGREWPTSPTTVKRKDFAEEDWHVLLAAMEDPDSDPDLAVVAGGAKDPEDPDRVIGPYYRERLVSLAAQVATAAGSVDKKNGLPTVPAIRSLSGLPDVSAAERDAAVEPARPKA